MAIARRTCRKVWYPHGASFGQVWHVVRPQRHGLRRISSATAPRFAERPPGRLPGYRRFPMLFIARFTVAKSWPVSWASKRKALSYLWLSWQLV